MELRTFDDEAFVVDGETFFHLWCCDCSLRHMVLIEPIGKAGEQFKKQNGKLAIGMLCDRESTEMARENKIVTQMGNQGASNSGMTKVQEWFNDGKIGTVDEVDEDDWNFGNNHH